MPSEKPVIFLAFANDRVEGEAYLRNVPKELKNIRNALVPAENADACEVIERANADLGDIKAVFQDKRYRNRIAVFHYGGHASSHGLLLQDGNAGTSGLASFLGMQKGLKLVFLNGCSSKKLGDSLLQKDIPAVVYTTSSVRDEVALQLASNFYGAFAQHISTLEAWEQACSLVCANFNIDSKAPSSFRDFYFWEDDIPDAFPWMILSKDNKNHHLEWALPSKDLTEGVKRQVVSIINGYYHAEGIAEKIRKGVELDIPIPRHIFHKINCDRREFMQKLRAMKRKERGIQIFVLPGSKPQQAESLMERMVLELEYGHVHAIDGQQGKE